MLSLECFCWALVPDMPLDRKHANDFRYIIKALIRSWHYTGLLVSGLPGLAFRFGRQTFQKVGYSEVNSEMDSLMPVYAGSGCRRARLWTSDSSN